MSMRAQLVSLFQDAWHAIRFLVIVLIPFVLGPALGWTAGHGVALAVAPAPAGPVEPAWTPFLAGNRYSIGGGVAGLILGPMIACALAKRLNRGPTDIDDEEPAGTLPEGQRS